MYLEDWKPAREKPVHYLTCAVCGAETRGRQWWNRDTGYGVCSTCIDWLKMCETPEEIRSCYGLEGTHYNVTEYPPLTCYRVYFDNGTSPLINLAAGITLQQATDYYLGKTFIDEAPETGKETRHTCIKVEAYQGV